MRPVADLFGNMLIKLNNIYSYKIPKFRDLGNELIIDTKFFKIKTLFQIKINLLFPLICIFVSLLFF